MTISTRPLRASRIEPFLIWDGFVSGTNFFEPGSWIRTTPLTRKTLSVWPATGGGSVEGGGCSGGGGITAAPDTSTSRVVVVVLPAASRTVSATVCGLACGKVYETELPLIGGPPSKDQL